MIHDPEMLRMFGFDGLTIQQTGTMSCSGGPSLRGKAAIDSKEDAGCHWMGFLGSCQAYQSHTCRCSYWCKMPEDGVRITMLPGLDYIPC